MKVARTVKARYKTKRDMGKDENSVLGSKENPYLIDSVAALKGMSSLDTAPGVQYFKQTANIDLTNQSWTPFEFGGVFDGNGKKISHVKIDLPDSDYVGFFSTLLSGGELRGIKLEDVDVKGRSIVGGLVGLAYGSISNSYTSGSVEGTGYNVGGLVGYNNSSISNSYASSSVEGTGYNVGGLVGYNNSSISNSYASGDVMGTSSSRVGGLVGYNNGKISDSYASGNVTGYAYVGGLVGVADSNSSVSNSYYDSETSNRSDTGKGIPRTTIEMKTGTPSGTIYTGWDSTIWNFGDDTDYPTLKK